MATQHNFRIKNGLEVAGTQRISSSGAVTPQSLSVTADASVGGNLTVTGNLVVNGSTTTIDTATLSVEDINITVASGAGNATAANGAGLTVAGANATLLYASADDSFGFNKKLKVNPDIRLGSEGVRLSTDGNGEFGIGYGQTATNSRFSVYNNTTVGLRVYPTGNVYVPDTFSVGTTSTLKGYFYESTPDQNGTGKPSSVLGLAAYVDARNEGPSLDFNAVWGGGAVYQQDNWNEGWTVGRIAGVYDSAGLDTGALAFYTQTSGSSGGASSSSLTEKMRITSDGQVGIGTDPTTDLDILSTGARIKLRNSGGHQINFGLWDGSNHRLEADANRKLLITSYHSDGIHLGGSGNSHFVVKGGNVGVGSTNPTTKFVVQNTDGHNGIEFSMGSTLNYIQSYNRNTSDYSHLKIDAETIKFGTNNGSERARFDENGRFRIGTSIQTVPFQVGNAKSDTLTPVNAVAKFYGYTDGDGLAIGNYSSSPYGSYLQSGYLLDSYSTAYNNGYPIVLNPVGGNVGIGAITNGNPLTKLHVNGGAVGDMFTLQTSYNTGSSKRAGINWRDASEITGSIWTSYDGSNVSMRFGQLYNGGYRTSDTSGIFVITGNGNVGIANDQNQLDSGVADLSLGAGSKSHGIHLSPYFQIGTRYAAWNCNMGWNARAQYGTTSGGIEQATGYGGGGASNFSINATNLEWHQWDAAQTTGYGTSLAVNSTYLHMSCDSNGHFNIKGSYYNNASDRRLKDNITPITNALDKVKQLSGNTFTWKETLPDTDQPLPSHKAGKDDMGVIAQEVKEVVPTAVALSPWDVEYKEVDNPDYDPNDESKGPQILKDTQATSASGKNYLTVNEEKLVPLLIEAIKELEARVAELEG